MCGGAGSLSWFIALAELQPAGTGDTSSHLLAQECSGYNAAIVVLLRAPISEQVEQ